MSRCTDGTRERSEAETRGEERDSIKQKRLESAKLCVSDRQTSKQAAGS